jgi:DNA-binding CsgD family transcriptional regulator
VAALAVLTQPQADGETSGPFASAAENEAFAAYILYMLSSERCRGREYRWGIAGMEAAMTRLDAAPHQVREHIEGLLNPSPHPFDYRHGILVTWLGPLGYFARARTLAQRILARGAAERKTRVAYAIDGHANYGLISAYASLGQPEEARAAYRAGLVAYGEAALPNMAGTHSVQALVWIALPYFADDLAERRRLAAEAEQSFLQASALPHFSPRFGQLPLLLIEGNWEEARTLALATRALGFGAIYSAVSGRTLAPLALAQGDRDLVWSLIHEDLPRGVRTEPGDAMYPNAVLLQRIAASLSVATGDLVAAHGWLEAHDRWQAWSESVLGVAEGHLGWAAYHRAAGDPEQAYERATRALTHASDPRQPLALLAAHRMLGELDADAGRFVEAQGHLNAALILADACAAPYERALTLLALATLQAAMNDRPAALTLLDEARAVFVTLNAVPALVQVDTLRARLVPEQRRAPHPDGLTAREVMVLRLIAAGRSNREIAATLSISERTVNRHITNLYTKIDAHGRADATAYVFQHDLLVR